MKIELTYDEYETFNEKGDLINIGEVSLVFINKKTKKPCYAPEEIINKLKEKWIN